MAQHPESDHSELVLDFDNAPKRAPRVWRPVFPILVVLAIIGILFSLVWGGYQTAGLYAATSGSNTPMELAAAQNNYFSQHKAYTTDLSKLQLDNGKPFTPAFGTSVQMAGVCSSGWVAKIGENGGGDYYLTSGGDQAKTLDSLPLPACMSVADIGKDPRNSTISITDLAVGRSSKVGEKVSGKREGAHITWKATNQCEANATPSYQVKITMQRPTGATGDDYLFDPVVLETPKTDAQVEDIKNGMTYTVEVSGTCGENYTNQAAKTDFTQGLPAPQVLINRGGSGRWDVLVSASSSPFIAYNIQYKHAYSDGWTSFARNFMRGTLANPSGYYYNSGDLFRAKAVRVDGAVASDYGTGRGLRTTDAYSYYTPYSYSYNGYRTY